jgi:secondary thiamine-phosphate synthase enzyme
MMQTTFKIQTNGQSLYEFTDQVTSWVRGSGVLTLFIQHTSASILIQENADPEVRTDLTNYFRKLVPPANDPSMHYLAHRYEGDDDMPAHIKAAMLPVSIQIPVMEGRLAFGRWQGIYLFEHRDAPCHRCVIATLV